MKERQRRTPQQLLNLHVSGGFLDGLKIDFAPGLNCIIGARGAGKTSVLEFLRYALDCMPDADAHPAEHKRIMKLVEHNLGDHGSIRVRFRASDGSVYIAVRESKKPPQVLTEDETVTAVPLTALLKPNVYSHSEIEAIANDAESQLALIDRFESEKLQTVATRLREFRGQLRINGSKVLDLREKIAGMEEQLSLLSVVEEKLSRLPAIKSAGGKELEKANALKALRQRESRAVTGGIDALGKVEERIGDLSTPMRSALAELAQEELRRGPNGDALREIHERMQATREWLEATHREVTQRLERERTWLKQAQTKLTNAQHEQDHQYKTLLEQHRQLEGPARERALLEVQRHDLLAVRAEKDRLEVDLNELQRERGKLLSDISDLQAERYALRSGIVQFINGSMDEHIRVSIENLGDQDDYQKLLEEKLKGSGANRNQAAQKLMAMTPAELVELLKVPDTSGIAARGGLNPQQAMKITPALAEPAVLLEIESVALRDRPKIELNDQGTFKITPNLSKGQKSTAVLPILLMDGDWPMMVDQPEDNLDNRFISKTIVDKIRRSKSQRQLIFCTLSPNVVVLSAADRIFVLESNGQTSRLTHVGSVDERKNEIVNLLEGGAEAFQQRQQRYGY